MTKIPNLVGPAFDLSTDGETLVFCVSDGLDKAATLGLPFLGGADRGRLYMSRPFGSKAVEIAPSAGVGFASPRLSPDATRVAVLATDEDRFCPAVVDLASGGVRILTERHIPGWATAQRFQWLDDTRLVMGLLPEGQKAHSHEVENRSITAMMASWTEARARIGETARAIDSSDAVPMPEAFEMAICDLNTGEITCFDPEGALPEELRAFKDEKHASDFPPPEASDDDPVPKGSTVDLSAEGRSERAYVVRQTFGTEIHAHRGETCTKIWEADTHLSEVTPSKVETVPITDQFGTEQRIKIFEPDDGLTRQDRPVLFWIYPGLLPVEHVTHVGHFNDPSPLNIHLVAALGPTVVVPPIPLRSESAGKQDIAADLTRGVQRAAQHLFGQGVIPKDNCHVAGQSWGGWSTAMLLARTSLFRSGIAAAGLYDVAASCNAMDPRWLYQPAPLDQHGMLQSIYRLPGPPWQHPDLYRAQSPIFEVDQIDAPLLMLHGDQDYCPLHGAETMFVAMRNAGKIARLVRFDHEGHVLQIPANIERFYKELGDWVRQHS